MVGPDELGRRFEAERPRLRAIASRLLGSPADAEDAVQETWLRLQRVDADGIENLEAWLTTVVSRVSLDVLRAARRARERSWLVEAWPGEPVAGTGDPEAEAARSEQVGIALLVVLETLSPAERLAFVLHDVFGRPFGEVAEVLQRSPDAARQLASRARRRVRGAPVPTRADARRARRVVEAWLAAAQGGDFAALLGLLDEGAVLHADHGGRTQHVAGARAIAGQAVLFARLAAHSTPVLIGGRPGVAAVVDGRTVSVMAFEVAGDRVLRLDVLADPRRLAALDVPAVLRGG
ncbi:sigma-70 family RNA polymerase sigma factor [Kineococcus glutinatus]|uniref:RNA polymerase sigma factor SigJ n=1 Tax=Kineococcus glutinatus TaxID=1070872 RepID=A0ABP9I9P7_9ACTN